MKKRPALLNRSFITLANYLVFVVFHQIRVRLFYVL